MTLNDFLTGAAFETPAGLAKRIGSLVAIAIIVPGGPLLIAAAYAANRLKRVRV